MIFMFFFIYLIFRIFLNLIFFRKIVILGKNLNLNELEVSAFRKLLR